jgi:hypothetical protein
MLIYWGGGHNYYERKKRRVPLYASEEADL